MSYKIVAIDLDDTIIDSGHQISARAQKKVKEAIDKGIAIVISTGRTYMGAKKYIDLLQLNSPSITCGGAMIMDGNGKPLFQSLLKHETVKALLHFAKDNDVHAQVYFGNDYFFFEDNDSARDYAVSYGFPGIANPGLLEETDLSTPKVLFIAPEEKLITLQNELAAVYTDLNIVRSKPTYLEFTNPEASKGRALAFITEYLGCSREEVIAIGDGEIDISMIEYAGLGIAVENALPSVKAAADMITHSNDEDGVAYVLEKFVLEE